MTHIFELRMKDEIEVKDPRSYLRNLERFQTESLEKFRLERDSNP